MSSIESALSYHKDNIDDKIKKEEKAMEIITSALQADESKYTKEIDEAVFIMQSLVEKRKKEKDTGLLWF